MQIIKSLAIATALSFSANLAADSDYDHFPSLEAPDLKSALCNLRDYNQTLATITSQEEISTVDMVKIHELTYTLENAIARLREELATTADDLEDVHKASERLDSATIEAAGAKYFATTQALLNGVSCDE